MNRHFRFVGPMISLLLLTGCCHLAMRPRPFPRQTLPENLAGEFAEPAPGGFLVREISMQTNRTFVLRRLVLRLPSRPAGSNQMIALDAFLPRRMRTPVPVIVVEAISGGDYQLEHHVARYFAWRGFAAIAVRRAESDWAITTGGQINELLKRSVQNDLRVVDWIETQPEFDAQRIGGFAVSLGAIQGTLFMAWTGGCARSRLGWLAATSPIFCPTRRSEVTCCVAMPCSASNT